MEVIKILGVLAVLWGIYLLGKEMNIYTKQRYNYEFLDQGAMIVVSVAYYLLYGGYHLYEKALSSGGDILNGEVLMGLGAIVLLLIIYNNFKNTNLFVGVFFSVIQLVICGVVAIGFLVILALATAAASSRYNYYDDDHY